MLLDSLPHPTAPEFRRLAGRSGQFIPISAMIMFTIVTLMVAVVNIYKVARAKLQVQNLADATALNVASQMARSLNNVTDRNESLNHMTEDPNNDEDHDTRAAAWQMYVSQMEIAVRAKIMPNLVDAKDDKHGMAPLLPGNQVWKWPPISFAANYSQDGRGYVFRNKQDARDYASTVYRINQAQLKFMMAYNSFIGAPNQAGPTSSASTLGSVGLQDILLKDIAEFRSYKYSVAVWNTGTGQNLSSTQNGGFRSTSRTWLRTDVRPLTYEIQDVVVAYLIAVWDVPQMSAGTYSGIQVRTATLTQLAHEEISNAIPLNMKVGWLSLPGNPSSLPTIGKSGHELVGAGAMVSTMVDIPVLGPKRIGAVSTAYVVPGSGGLPSGDLGATAYGKPSVDGMGRPVFHPTFWVKLGGR